VIDGDTIAVHGKCERLRIEVLRFVQASYSELEVARVDVASDEEVIGVVAAEGDSVSTDKKTAT